MMAGHQVALSRGYHGRLQTAVNALQDDVLKGTRHVVNRAATALRLAATTLLRSQSYLGAQYRRLRGKLGAPKAITAMVTCPAIFGPAEA